MTPDPRVSLFFERSRQFQKKLLDLEQLACGGTPLPATLLQIQFQLVRVELADLLAWIGGEWQHILETQPKVEKALGDDPAA